jgi:hypothetical protein
MNKIYLFALGISVIAMNNSLLASNTKDEGEPKFTPHAIAPEQVESVRYRFGSTGAEAAFPFQIEGCSDREETHAWSNGKRVTLTIPATFENKLCKRLVIRDLRPFITPTHSQPLNVRVNDHLCRLVTFNIQNPEHIIDIPLPLNPSRPTVVTFDIPNACPVNSIFTDSSETRSLALAFQTAEIVFQNPQKKAINFGVDNVAPLMLQQGFGDAEIDHRWLVGNQAIVRIPQANDGKLISQITFNDVKAHISPTHSQKLIISGAGIERQEYDFNALTPMHNITVKLPLNHVGDFDLNFETPNACFTSFGEHPTDDARKLSICLMNANVTFFDIPKLRPLPASPVVTTAPKAAAKASPKAAPKASPKATTKASPKAPPPPPVKSPVKQPGTPSTAKKLDMSPSVNHLSLKEEAAKRDAENLDKEAAQKKALQGAEEKILNFRDRHGEYYKPPAPKQKKGVVFVAKPSLNGDEVQDDEWKDDAEYLRRWNLEIQAKVEKQQAETPKPEPKKNPEVDSPAPAPTPEVIVADRESIAERLKSALLNRRANADIPDADDDEDEDDGDE